MTEKLWNVERIGGASARNGVVGRRARREGREGVF